MQRGDRLSGQQVAAQLQEDPFAVCRLGGEALRAGDVITARKAFEETVRALRGLIHARDAETALALEFAFYEAFVKAVEDEEHYERCFAPWRDDMAALGRTFSRPLAPPRSARGIGFVVHNLSLIHI